MSLCMYILLLLHKIHFFTRKYSFDVSSVAKMNSIGFSFVVFVLLLMRSSFENVYVLLKVYSSF